MMMGDDRWTAAEKLRACLVAQIMTVNYPIMAMIGSRPPTIMDGCLEHIFEAPLTARKTTVKDSQKNCIFHGHDLPSAIISPQLS